MKSIMDYIGHDFYTTDELNELIADMGGISKFKNVKNFLDFMNLKQCAICKVYTSNHVKSPSLEHPPGEAALICNHCDVFQNNHNHTFAIRLAKVWVEKQIVLTRHQEIIRAESTSIIRYTKDLNMDAFTDTLKAKYNWKSTKMTLENYDEFTELEREYDKFICHLWSLVDVQDSTHFLFCGDGFTQTTIDKVFNDTREIVNYNREEFLNVYQLTQDTKSKLYRRHENATQ